MIHRIVVGELETNCYILYGKKDAFIIDPGGDEAEIISFISSNNLNPIGIINTHGHIDHIMANKPLKKKYDCPIYIHYFDAPMLTNPVQIPFLPIILSVPADKLIDENDILVCEEYELKIIHTPGHTRGGICMLGEGFIFTGDTLFCGSVGRWDLPGGDEALLMESIKKILSLDKNLKILPGHGPTCTISGELEHNPFCRF